MELTAQELRIGNLAHFKPNEDCESLVVEIYNICRSYCRVYVDNELEEVMVYYSNKDFKPIPLTEEWAVKFGYENLVEMAADFSEESNYEIEINRLDFDLLSVHEAQNLYRWLTGKELTIQTKK